MVLRRGYERNIVVSPEIQKYSARLVVGKCDNYYFKDFTVAARSIGAHFYLNIDPGMLVRPEV